MPCNFALQSLQDALPVKTYWSVWKCLTWIRYFYLLSFLFVLTRTQLEVYKLLLADTQKIILLIKKTNSNI